MRGDIDLPLFATGAEKIDRIVNSGIASRSKIDELIQQKRLRAVKLDRATIILKRDWDAMLESLPARELEIA